MLNKVLYRDSKAVSFASVDSGRPIHVTKVNNHPGVYLWNPETKEMVMIIMFSVRLCFVFFFVFFFHQSSTVGILDTPAT